MGLANLTLPPAFAHALGQTQLYCPSRVAPWVMVRMTTAPLFLDALLILDELEVARGFDNQCLQLLISSQLA